MDQELAVKRLKQFAKEDSLRIITPFHVCMPPDIYVTDAQMATAAEDVRGRCREYAEQAGHTEGQPGGYRDVAHYRLVPVAKLEKDEKVDGWLVAFGDDHHEGGDGTVCRGAPADLLRRLTEHERE